MTEHTPTSLSTTSDDDLAAALTRWLPSQRWCSAPHEGGDVALAVRCLSREALVDTPELSIHLLLVEVTIRTAEVTDGDTDDANSPGRPGHPGDDGGAREERQLYQVPLAWRPDLSDLPGDLQDHTLPVQADNIYDALRDPEGLVTLAEVVLDNAAEPAVSFHTVHGAERVPATHVRPLAVEQSNTSVILDDTLLLKFFRRIQPGINPDVELHEALSTVSCPAIATLRGWWEGPVDGETTTLGMLQDFVPNTADGWAMATNSVRDLMAEGDLRAAEVGSDFAEESRRIGEALAHVHHDLATALGTSTRSGTEISEMMTRRLETAVDRVPQLAEYEAAIRSVIETVCELADVPAQRVHGDLHLGQLLRSPSAWLLIDFEGEPAAPLALRRTPDSPLRDLAGMLRSFDYAAHHGLVGAAPDRQALYRAREWAVRNNEAFLQGYRSVLGRDFTDTERLLLTAYQLDKAVYEVLYEAGHRPGWLPVPLSAVRRMTAAS